MPDARLVRPFDEQFVTVQAGVAVGEVWQTSDGKAAVYAGGQDGRTAASTGDRATFLTAGKYTFNLTSSIVILAGGRVYWDHSANLAHYKKVNDRDFYLGRAVGDSSSGTVEVDLNSDPAYDIDLARDPFSTTIIGTATTQLLHRRGGAHKIVIGSTSEAAKIDMLSKDGFARTANAIVELCFNVIDDGAGTVVDVSLGLANSSHSTDADSIVESLFVHLNANDVNIYLESDDNVVEVAATDSTIDYTMGDGIANRVEAWFDLRNEADIQCYINGVLALPSTVFKLDSATGPLRLLAHVEKTSAADTYEIDVEWMRVRLMEQ